MIRDKQTGQKGLTVVQAVELALTPQDCPLYRDNPHLGRAEAIKQQERMIAELVSVLHDRCVLTNSDVLRLVGKFRFEIA